MASIKDMLPLGVVVLRDSAQPEIPAAELVPSGLVYIKLGQKVPAELRLIDVSGDLKFDKSNVTGESEPVSSRIDMNILETKNIGLQRTLCVTGSCVHRGDHHGHPMGGMLGLACPVVARTVVLCFSKAHAYDTAAQSLSFLRDYGFKEAFFQRVSWY